MNSYTWEINSIKKNTVDSKPDVVTHIEWSIEGASQQDPEIKAVRSSIKTIAYVPGSQFTPFKELTKDQIIAWLQNDMAEKNETGQSMLECIYESIDSEIARKISDAEVTKG
jgi:hypothetical protein